MSKESKALEKKASQAWTSKRVFDMILNNALIIIMVIAVIYIAIRNPNFIRKASIINILSQTCAYLPVALGIGGCIVLTGTDLSAGRIVGLTACVSGLLAAGGNCLQQDVAQCHPTARSVGSGAGYGHRRGVWCLQRLLRGQVQTAPLHCHTGHTADRLYASLTVCQGRQQQRHGHLRAGCLLQQLYHRLPRLYQNADRRYCDSQLCVDRPGVYCDYVVYLE